MFKIIYFIVLSLQTINCNYIFENINFGIENNVVKKFNVKLMSLDNLIDNMNLETKIENLFEPTLEPTEEQKYVKTLEPSLEPTFEPTFEPTEEPTVITTFGPTVITTLEPTIIKKEIRYKILSFYVEIELVNFVNNELNDNDKDILLNTFEEITQVNREYLSIKDKNLRLRRLLLTKLDTQFYTLEETIIISIPLIDKYIVYEDYPLDLYDSLISLITDSFSSGLFQDIIKNYNSSSFINIQVNLVKISEAEITTVVPQDSNKNDLSNYKLALILSFGTLGLVLIFCIFYYKLFSKTYH